MATEAGYPKISFVSVLAGVLVAYGAFAIIAGILDQDAFAAEASVDAFRDVPPGELLTSLRGKDVVLKVGSDVGRR